MVLAAVALVVAVYTANYGFETWRQGNRFGAVMLFLLAASAFALPTFALLRQL
ncbi:MAG: hypothetical protein K6U08_09380 [Firmicutes bacterium]|nr:hypothetical protein [Bacillota bacterium]